MNLSEEKIKELEQTFKEMDFMGADDYIEESTKGDYYPSFSNQVRGRYYFTHERIIFAGGFGVHNFSVKYSDICAIKKSFVGPFLPFGITITVKNNENDSTQKHKLSLLSRSKWLELISTKSGVAYQ